MSSSQFFEESILIRKQREEIILLTNELKNQEIQLNIFNQENSKLKSSIKIYDKKLQECDVHMKIYENQIKEFKSTHPYISPSPSSLSLSYHFFS
jgi:hypothetical protein